RSMIMKLKIDNIKVGGAIKILDKLPLKGLKSIHRTSLSEQLQEHLKRIINEEDELRKEYCHLDDEENPKEIDGKLDLKDEEDVIIEFYKEKVIIDSGDSQVMLKSVKQSMEETDVEFKGEEAYQFADLYESIIGDNESQINNEVEEVQYQEVE